MTVDDVQNAAILLLFVLGAVQSWYLWRTNNGCAYMARAVRALQDRH